MEAVGRTMSLVAINPAYPLACGGQSLYQIGQVLGPICVSALAGRGADFSWPLGLACAVLLASAVALGWPAARATRYDSSNG